MKNFTRVAMSIILSLVSLIIAGGVIQYGWNNFIAQGLMLPNISLATAIGIDLSVTYITGHATPMEIELMFAEYEGEAKVISKFVWGMMTSAITFLYMYLFSRFL